MPLKDVVMDPDVCGKQLYIMAHAALANGETAFAGPDNFGSDRWAYYATYTICCGDVKLDYDYETAFIKFDKTNGFVFTTGKNSNPEKYPSLNLTQNRWGWAGLLLPGDYAFNIYAGAGLNNIKNATLVGKASITLTDTELTIAYQMFEGFVLREMHNYVSDEAPVTLAPGQFGNTYYFDPQVSSYSVTYPVNDVNKDGIYIIGHSVVGIPVK